MDKAFRASTLWLLVLFAALSGALVVWLPTLNRPLEMDEAFTMDAYTSFGYFTTRADLAAKPRFSLAQTVHGLARPLSNWKSWNAHVVSCWAISIGSFFLGFTERSARLPSLLANIGAATLLGAWIHARCKSIYLAALTGIAFCLCPGIFHYGQTARGFAMGLFLMMVNIAMVERLLLRLKPHWSMLVFAAISYLQLLNLMSTLFMWFIPVGAAVLLWLLMKKDDAAASSQSVTREAALIGWIGGGALAAIALGQFLLDRWSVLAHEQSRYGLTASNIHEFIAQSAAITRYVLPGWWVAVGVLGLFGWLITCIPKQRHWIGWAALGSVGLTLLYAVKSGKLPYERNCLLYVPLLLMGVACVWAWSRSLARSANLAIQGGIICVLLVVIATSLNPQRLLSLFRTDISMGNVCAAATRQLQQSGATPATTLVLQPFYADVAGLTRLYLPDSDAYYVPSGKDEQVQVIMPVDASAENSGFNCPNFRTPGIYIFHPLPASWSQYITQRDADSETAVYSVPMRRETQLPTSMSGAPLAIVAWEGVIKPRFDAPRFIVASLKEHEANLSADYLLRTVGSKTVVYFLVASDTDLQIIGQIIARLQEEGSGETFYFREDSKK
ncbi:MAG: hypothetical protein ABJF10_24010 [Chthoniobacter sp.]|uniref:ArnT family glycosyltransferase n=1 Tax=Chthoniobacter sp. TaxID=2510640 RepID=UPI0032A80625